MLTPSPPSTSTSSSTLSASNGVSSTAVAVPLTTNTTTTPSTTTTSSSIPILPSTAPSLSSTSSSSLAFPTSSSIATASPTTLLPSTSSPFVSSCPLTSAIQSNSNSSSSSSSSSSASILPDVLPTTSVPHLTSSPEGLPSFLSPLTTIPTHHHTDVIHDVCFNFHGTLLAMCGSDHQCTVYATKDWKLLDTFKAHDASVLRVQFGSPEFGLGGLLVTCSLDRTVRVWEQQQQQQQQPAMVKTFSSSILNTQQSGGGGGGHSKWIEKARFTESRAAVMDVDFAPPHLGLKLAAASVDGYVRIYEALDPGHPSPWSMVDELQVSNKETWTIAWCPSKYTISLTTSENTLVHPSAMFVVAGAFSPKIYYFLTSWACLEAPGDYEAAIIDIAWAPSMGRSYHLIATASKDGLLRIMKLQGQMFSLLSVIAEHTMDIFRVHWNVTGSFLASTSKDGSMRIWKPSTPSFTIPLKLTWECVRVLQPGSDSSK